MWDFMSYKLVFVGDSQVGKTCFACSYLDDYFPDPSNTPKIRDPPIIQVMYNDRSLKIQPYDTVGEEDYAGLRSMQYSQVEVFILCFSLVDQKSLEHIETYWIPEIENQKPDVPYILVGMKSDLRESSSEKVTTEQGQEMKEKIGAQDYVECSSLKKIGLKDVMESVLKVLVQQIEKKEQENHVRSDSSTYSDYGSDDDDKKEKSSSDSDKKRKSSSDDSD